VLEVETVLAYQCRVEPGTTSLFVILRWSNRNCHTGAKASCGPLRICAFVAVFYLGGEWNL